jgi:tripartite tricarboxylate transporter TctA family protein
MFETIVLVGVIALVIIAYQLQAIRRVLENMAKLSAEERQQASTDKMTRDACPHVFFQFRAGAWVPVLTLGILGDSITATVLGIMMMKNLPPGPEIFDNQAVLVYSLYRAGTSATGPDG